MIKIYHNPRCQKSRNTLEILKSSGKSYEVIKYLENPPSVKELQVLLNLLQMKAENLIRKNERIWKDHYKNKILNEDELIKIMAAHPKLIERPIVINDDKAIIGRPPENVNSIL